MKIDIRRGLILIAAVLLLAQSLYAETPLHYYNHAQNLNPDPNYVPGAYPLPETHAAKTLYQVSKQNLIQGQDLEQGSSDLVTLSLGQISFTNLKNEKIEVLGYFRNYFGVVRRKPSGFNNMEMVIDLNSLDTAIPGRNNRILDILLQSTKPNFGTAKIHFTQLNFLNKTLETLQNGQVHELKAVGELDFNGVKREIKTTLITEYKNNLWTVRTLEPILLRLSDFELADRAYKLMKACNHKAVGNEVHVSVELFFK